MRYVGYFNPYLSYGKTHFAAYQAIASNRC
jgi:hypothetical protein